MEERTHLPISTSAQPTTASATQLPLPTSVPVLIVGGGPVGLCASFLLARHGVRSLLVERHAGTSLFPRARGVDIRSMELFRVLGLEAEVKNKGFAQRGIAYVLTGETLTGPVHKRMEFSQEDPALLSTISPSTTWLCAQDELEPILLAHVQRFPEADIHFNSELLSFQQDASGVTARILDRMSGKAQEVRADYLIAADGASSRVRTLLDISMTGPGVLGSNAQCPLPRGFTGDLGDRLYHLYQHQKCVCPLAPIRHHRWEAVDGCSWHAITQNEEKPLRTIHQNAVPTFASSKQWASLTFPLRSTTWQAGRWQPW